MNSFMQLNEEIVKTTNENVDKIEQFRDTAIVISNINDSLFVHTNIFDIKNQIISDHSHLNESEDNSNNESNIIDVSRMTQKLEIDDIQLITAETLNPQISITKEELKSFSNNNWYSQVKDANSFVVKDASYGLASRKKGEKLSSDQIEFLKSILSDPSISTIEISKAYSVSSSVLNRIKRSWVESVVNNRIRGFIKIYGSKKQNLWRIISDFVQNTNTTLIAREITEHVNTLMNTEYTVGFIRTFMKTHMRMSFKRVKSRPNNVNLLKIGSIRRLYAVKLSKSISRKSLLINIDESSINRSVKTLYSWSFKGISNEKKNSSFSGSISWILAICSNGFWICFLINQTIDSNSFIWFLKILNQWLIANKNFGYDEIFLLLDNCSTHKSEVTQSLFKKLPYFIYYLPAYSPELAPVEMCFSILKRNLSEQCKTEMIKLSLKYNYIKIHRSLMKLTCKVIKKMFSRFFKIIQDYISI